MPRRIHETARLNNIQEVKENLYEIGRLVHQVRQLGIRIEQSEVVVAVNSQRDSVAKLVCDEFSDIHFNTANDKEVFNRVRKLSKAMGRLKLD